MMRDLMTGLALAAAFSIALISFSMSEGLITSGSNFTCIEALAGQISVTPLIFAFLIAVAMDSDLKKASSDISSSHSTKMCSSPP